jgi:calcineurin-like phosphoesterase family protein
MKYLITTDTHFNHEILKKYCGRPENVDEIIRLKLTKAINKDDILIHLGDVCIGNDVENNEWFKTLPCKKLLIKGNHDSKSNSWYISHGWDFVCDRMDIEIYGKRLSFTHAPIAWDGYFDLNIHGHFHNTDHRRFEPEFNKILSGYNKLIALENTNYEPVDLKSLI